MKKKFLQKVNVLELRKKVSLVIKKKKKKIVVIIRKGQATPKLRKLDNKTFKEHIESEQRSLVCYTTGRYLRETTWFLYYKGQNLTSLGKPRKRLKRDFM